MKEQIFDTSGIDFGSKELRIVQTPIQGVLVVSRDPFKDARGGFQEEFRPQDVEQVLGEKIKPLNLGQIQQSWSVAGVLRGMHAGPEDKFIFPMFGVFYVGLADVRKNSPTFGKSLVLKIDNSSLTKGRMCGYFVRRGVANGFYLKEASGPEGFALYSYAVTTTYNSNTSNGFKFDDPIANIPWPKDMGVPVVSEKDLAQPSFKEFVEAVDQKMYE